MNRRNGRSVLPRLAWLLLVGAGLALPGGCGGGPKQNHLSGRVQFDGKPLPAGEIYFDPDLAKGNDGPQGFARIKDGQYDTRQSNTPAGSGAYVVRILGFDGKTPPGVDLPLGRPLFAEYKTATDIPDQKDGKLDFEVPAKAAAR